MLLEAALLTLAIGLLAGGRLGRLREIEVRGLAFFVAAAAVRLALLALAALGSPLLVVVGPVLLVGSFLVLLGAVWANRHLRALWPAGLGLALNALVITANGGSMPGDRALAVRAYGERSALVRLLDSPGYTLHKAATPETRLRALGDVLPLPLFPPQPSWYCPGSIGDVLVTLGACSALLWGLGAFGLRRAPPRRPEGAR